MARVHIRDMLMATSATRLYRATALVAALCVLVSPTLPASAHTSSAVAQSETTAELEATTERLETLEERITAGEAEMERLSSRLGDLVSRVGDQQAGVEGVRKDLGRIEIRIRDTREELKTLRTRISARARDLYKHGTLDLIDIVLDARSLGDLADRMVYVGTLVREDSAALHEAERLKGEFEGEQEEKQELLRQEQAKLRALEDEQAELRSVFAAQQDRIADLARARAEALELVERLEDRLEAERLASARRVAGKGMPITFGEWAESFLPSLGVSASRNNLVVVVAWQAAEYTRATWNPLATTMPMPGATVFNSHGVRNYTSKEQGIDATIKTLYVSGHGYDRIRSNLAAGADPMETARAIRDSDWCAGCAGGNYVVGLVEAVEQYYDRYASR